jgi:hypothetical protein
MATKKSSCMPQDRMGAPSLFLNKTLVYVSSNDTDTLGEELVYPSVHLSSFSVRLAAGLLGLHACLCGRPSVRLSVYPGAGDIRYNPTTGTMCVKAQRRRLWGRSVRRYVISYSIHDWSGNAYGGSVEGLFTRWVDVSRLPKLMRYAWSYSACKAYHLAPIWHTSIGCSFQ